MSSPASFEHHGFLVEPLTAGCRRVWDSRRHVVLGVSPGNSYFNVDRLRVVIQWLKDEFEQIDVIVPDQALHHTFLALGYEQEKAAKKSRAETNVLRNRVLRAWDDVGGPRRQDGLHRMSEIADDPTYVAALERCSRAVDADPVLRVTCEDMTRTVLAAKGLQDEPDATQIAEARKYLLAELPFFVSSGRLFDVESSLNFYHLPIPLANVIFAGGSALKADYGQGYATIRPATT